jgi:D-alanyl-D-alanine carboxypeptidase (penicillin-binding protein 5/6)
MYQDLLMNLKVIKLKSLCLLLFLTLIACLSLALVFGIKAFASINTAPTIAAPSAILIHQGGGEVLWDKNSRQQRAIASTTKILSALVDLEISNPSEQVIISPRVMTVPGNKIGLRAGDVVTVNDLLYGMLLASGNDAAFALAEKIAGSEENFVSMMNQEAVKVGAVASHFANSYGLSPASIHYSTAYDLAIIANVAMSKEPFKKIVSSKSYVLALPGRQPIILKNSNKLLWDYLGSTGIKTGFTNEAGYCLVASARKGKTALIAVILGDSTRLQSFNDGMALLDYGFNNYEVKSIINKGKAYAKVKVKKGKKKFVSLVAKKQKLALIDKQKPVKYSVELRRDVLVAPVKANQLLGYVKVSQGGNQLGRQALYSSAYVAKSVKKLNFWQIVLKRGINFFGGLLGFKL